MPLFLSSDHRPVRCTAHFHACLKPMLFVCGFTDRNQELAGLPTASSVNVKHIAQVAVGALIERSHEPYARLNSQNTARPGHLLRAFPWASHQSSPASASYVLSLLKTICMLFTLPQVFTQTARILISQGLQESASDRLQMFFRAAGRWLLKNQCRF